MAVTTQQRFAHAGEHAKALRLQQQLTQTELATRAGINTSTLSLIESGKRPGTVEVHGKIARALGLTLSELYAGLEGPRRQSAAFQSTPPKAEAYTHPGLGFSMQPLTTNVLEKRMMPLLLHLDVGGATVEEQARLGSQTEKFVSVQDGTVEVQVGEERFTLQPHQTLYFDATLPHRLRNTGTAPASVFLVVSPPTL